MEGAPLGRPTFELRGDRQTTGVSGTLKSRVMNSAERHAHWQTVYQTKGEHDVSWFEESPAISLELIRATSVSTTASIIDIGGGTSRLVDALLDEVCSAVTVLDLSEKALETPKTRLGPQSAAKAKWVAVDVTAWEPAKRTMCGTTAPRSIF